jgi:diguanylate cyclase (GGDEF)-like protein
MGEGGAVTHVVTVAVDVTRRMLAEEALKATKEEAEAARDQVSNLLKNLAIAHTELEQKNRDLEKLSITDRLTGLYNRRKLDEEIAEEYARAKRSHLPLSVIMMDIDRFKSVNDNLGHQAGDRVLSEFANILRRTIREVDLVGRWGGEEFMIQCPGTDLGGAVSLAEKLRETIATHVFEDGGRMTGSFGVTDLRPNETLDEMIKRADDALYRAKKSGRNRVESG